METRKITLVTSNERFDIESNATTLKEFKAELEAKGIDYSGKTFMVAVAKVELKDDEALLPTNLPSRNGGTTNDLVILMTNEQKKVKSGVSRAELNAYFKANPEAAAAVKAREGKNYTQVSSAVLESYMVDGGKSKETVVGTPVEDPQTPAPHAEETSASPSCTLGAVLAVVAELHKKNQLSTTAHDIIMAVAAGKPAPAIKEVLSDDEVRKMFDWVSEE